LEGEIKVEKESPNPGMALPPWCVFFIASGRTDLLPRPKPRTREISGKRNTGPKGVPLGPALFSLLLAGQTRFAVVGSRYKHEAGDRDPRDTEGNGYHLCLLFI
jgi:hypothetical protein